MKKPGRSRNEDKGRSGKFKKLVVAILHSYVINVQLSGSVGVTRMAK